MVAAVLTLCIAVPIQTQAEQSASASMVGPQLSYFNQLDQAGILLLNGRAGVLQSKSSQHHFIPASTTKLLTALLALRHWGEDYRFKTAFSLVEGKASSSRVTNESIAPILLVKGYGDPFLVSEELLLIAKAVAKRLKERGIHALSGIQLDTSYFATHLNMPGAGDSDNPYDAIPSALAVNFNTVYIRKTSSGFESAEPQTPMTLTALQVAQNITNFKEAPEGLIKRVNLGANVRLGQRYFAELLNAFLRNEGIAVGSKVSWQTQSERMRLASETQSQLNSSSRLLYLHENSRTLEDIVRPMMLYSTNFVANQLALNLSAELIAGSADEHSVAQMYQQSLTTVFGWSDFHIEDGAGLSRKNRLSPRQLIDVLNAFKPWRHLLPEVEQNVFAKSGTLFGVSTLAGYIHADQEWYPFAFMINQKVPYYYRIKLVKELSERY
jgi:D-alanyl-D-alanine carboxypeptidase/D-alanyl-D-alanine-endopeptidase (penicillin-binding protein 4)